MMLHNDKELFEQKHIRRTGICSGFIFIPPVMSGPQFPMFQQSPQIPPEQFMTMVQMYMPFLQQMAAMMGNQGVPFDFRQTKIKGEVVNSMITVADFIPYWEEFYKEQVSLNSYNHDS